VRASVWVARTCLLLEAVIAGQMAVFSASSLARLLIWLMGIGYGVHLWREC
jgi:hypothetical protein